MFDLEGVRRRLGEQWQWIKAYNLTGMQAAGTAMLIAWMEQFGAPEMPGSVLSRDPHADHAHLGPARPRDAAVSGRGRAPEIWLAPRSHRRRRRRSHLEQPEAFLGALRKAIGVSRQESV